MLFKLSILFSLRTYGTDNLEYHRNQQTSQDRFHPLITTIEPMSCSNPSGSILLITTAKGTVAILLSLKPVTSQFIKEQVIISLMSALCVSSGASNSSYLYLIEGMQRINHERYLTVFILLLYFVFIIINKHLTCNIIYVNKSFGENSGCFTKKLKTELAALTSAVYRSFLCYPQYNPA